LPGGNEQEEAFRPGSIVDDRFRIEEVIGEGGMGVVVRAVHLKLGSQVALKFLQPAALAERVVVERFEREARAAARLTSDHIARITDVGSLPNGAPFIIMEYLTGETLAAMLRRRGALPIAEASHIMSQVAEGLAEAHSSGIVHRDLKPANVFLASKPNGKTVVKLLDFGISKVEEGLGVDPELTTATTLLGTPNYMAPEQLVSAKTVDSRADIWSCGVVLHRMLSGQVPFDADSIIQLSVKLMNEEPPDLSQLRGDVPPGLAKIVRKCLERDPKNRWQTTLDLSRALHPYASSFESSRLPPLAADTETVKQPFPTRPVTASSLPPAPRPSQHGSGPPPPPPPISEDALAETHDLFGPHPPPPPPYSPASTFGSIHPTQLPSHTPLAGPMETVPPPDSEQRTPTRLWLAIVGDVIAAGAILVIAFITRSQLNPTTATTSSASSSSASSIPASATTAPLPTAPASSVSAAPETAPTVVPPVAVTATSVPPPPAATTNATVTSHPPPPKTRPPFVPVKKTTPTSKPQPTSNSPIPDER